MVGWMVGFVNEYAKSVLNARLMGDTASANSLYVATEPFWLQFLPALAKCVGHNSQMKTVLLFALWCLVL
jgi:hypothetical protein